jgi:hypothetical protein
MILGHLDGYSLDELVLCSSNLALEGGGGGRGAQGGRYV